jgi:predicted DNA-binding transcriptional regulator AlpA
VNALRPDEVLALPAVVDVPTAGRAYGISERHAYELARRGEFPVPVRRLGRLSRVRRADLLEDLGIDPNSSEAGPATGPASATTDLATARELKSCAG